MMAAAARCAAGSGVDGVRCWSGGLVGESLVTCDKRKQTLHEYDSLVAVPRTIGSRCSCLRPPAPLLTPSSREWIIYYITIRYLSNVLVIATVLLLGTITEIFHI